MDGLGSTVRARLVDYSCEIVALGAGKHTYAHGGGFGFAIEMLADPKWADVLGTQEPELYNKCRDLLKENKGVLDEETAAKVILLMENSPVLSAYARAALGDGFTPELDVWIDYEKPENAQAAKVVHGNLFVNLLLKISLIGPWILNHSFLVTDIANAPSLEEWYRKYRTALSQMGGGTDTHKIAGICLDIKSPWSTAADVFVFATHVEALLDTKVKFVGSFDKLKLSALRGSITAVEFFHGIWDLEAASENGIFQCVMFNGADLLVRSGEKEKAFVINEKSLARLRSIHDSFPESKIGIYVQETDLGSRACCLLNGLVEKEPDLFELGFALGGATDSRLPRMLKGRGAGIQQIMLSDGFYLKALRVLRGISFFHTFCTLQYKPLRKINSKF